MHGSIGPSCAVALWENDGVDRLDAQPGRLPAAQVPGRAARACRRQGTLHPYRGFRLLRPQRRRRCRGRRSARCARRARPAGAPAMDARAGAWLGAAGLGDGGRAGGRARRDGRIAGWRHDVWSNAHNDAAATAGGLLAGAEVEPPFPPPTAKPIPMPEGGGASQRQPALRPAECARAIYHFVEHSPVRVSALRSLGAHMNVFAIECFMDELAKAAGADPLAFRLAHHGGRPRPRGHADRRPIASAGPDAPKAATAGAAASPSPATRTCAAYCAVAMEVAVDRDSGDIQIPRVVAAVDSGEAVNPDGIRNQIEGAIIQSLSWTTQEAVDLRLQRIAPASTGAPTRSCGSTPCPAGSRSHVIDRPRQPFLGTGEAGQGPAAAALANAVADACPCASATCRSRPKR